MARQPEDEAFRPGQLGTRHLLGAMTVVCIVAGLSAWRLRTLPPKRAAIVTGHWLAVAGVAGAIGYRVALRRRRDRLRAGQLLLSVMRFPITGNRRKWTVWGLTAAVILDGVVMSVLVLPAAPLFDSQDDFPPMLGFAVQVVLVQAILWCACLDGWTYDVALGFHEHGLLTKERFYAWTTISRIQWTSPQLAVYGEHSLIVGIDPADIQSVTGVLEIIRQKTDVPITSE